MLFLSLWWSTGSNHLTQGIIQIYEMGFNDFLVENEPKVSWREIDPIISIFGLFNNML